MRKQHFDWSGIDWTLPDRAIARRLGCHPRAVKKQRFKRQMPAPASYRHGGLDWEKADWNLFDWEIAANLGCNTHTVHMRRKKMNLALIYGH